MITDRNGIVLAQSYSAYTLEIQPSRVKSLDETIDALAGIGNPERFFAQLRAMGIDAVTHPLPDHHPFTAADLARPGASARIPSRRAAGRHSRRRWRGREG